MANREKHVETRAFSRLAGGAHETVMVHHDLFTDGKADAGPGKFALVVQALKNVEDPPGMLLLKADAVIGD